MALLEELMIIIDFHYQCSYLLLQETADLSASLFFFDRGNDHPIDTNDTFSTTRPSNSPGPIVKPISPLARVLGGCNSSTRPPHSSHCPMTALQCGEGED